MQKERRVWILLRASPTGWERAKHAGPPLITGGQWPLGKPLSRQIQAVRSGLGELVGALALGRNSSSWAGVVWKGQASPGHSTSCLSPD